MDQRLLEYKKDHGNTKVPYRYAEDRQLGQWVSKQRSDYKKAQLSTEHTGLLNSIDFDWGAQQSNWNEMYERLISDMDINAGAMLTEGQSLEEKGREIYQMLLDVASGAPSKSEAQGLGDYEFVPWQIGATM